MEKFLKKINRISEKLNEDNISEFAAETSFFIILSLAPFIIFFFTIFKYSNFGNDILFFIINEIIPKGMEDFIFGLLNENKIKTINLISISGIILIWSASKGIFSIIKGIRNIYKIKEKSIIYMKIEACIYTIIVISLVSIIISAITFIYLKIDKLLINNNIFLLKYDFFEILKILFIIILYFLFFVSIYIIIPKKDREIKKQLPGTFFATIVSFLGTKIFSLYIEYFENKSIIYGSLNKIVLLMVWLYFCIYIIFIGAEINVAYEKYKK